MVPVSRQVDDVVQVGLNRSLKSVASRIQELEERRALDLDFWKYRCLSAEKERAELKKLNVALDVKLGELIQTNEKLDTKTVASYEARILALEEQVHSFYQSERLAISDAPELSNDMIRQISQSMTNISGSIQRFFEGQELRTRPMILGSSEDDQLRSLCAKAFNVDVVDASSAAFLKVLTERTTPQILLRALTAAAVAEWVFHDAGKDILFDRYDGDSTRGLLSRYARALEYIASRGKPKIRIVFDSASYKCAIDPRFARNMDLKIHRDVISDASFRAFLDTKAADLAKRLQGVLAPLYSNLKRLTIVMTIFLALTYLH